jgi:ubiquitin-small subunit ribosomal protein S27Ae
MQVFVQSRQPEPLLVELPAGATVKDLKNAVEDAEFIPAHLQRLVYGSLTLTGGLLAEIIPDTAVVSLEMGVDGGMRAKWRKKRMRRLRRRRRRMRNRAK